MCWRMGFAALAVATSIHSAPDTDADCDVGPRRRPLVAGIGYGHTGTTSLASALRSLHLRTKHWAPETRRLLALRLSGGSPPPPLLSKRRSPAYPPPSTSALLDDHEIDEANKQFEWGWQLLDETDAILDEPVNLFWRNIYRRFPDTKFVLTLRNVTEWADSEYLWYNHDEQGNMDPLAMEPKKDWDYWGWCNKPFNVSCATKFFEYSFGTSKPAKQDLIRAYEEHVQEVRRILPKNQLLEMDISKGDGYEKLAPFLGLPLPVNKRTGELQDFPSNCNGHCIHTDKPAHAVSTGQMAQTGASRRSPRRLKLKHVKHR